MADDEAIRRIGQVLLDAAYLAPDDPRSSAAALGLLPRASTRPDGSVDVTDLAVAAVAVIHELLDVAVALGRERAELVHELRVLLDRGFPDE